MGYDYPNFGPTTEVQQLISVWQVYAGVNSSSANATSVWNQYTFAQGNCSLFLDNSFHKHCSSCGTLRIISGFKLGMPDCMHFLKVVDSLKPMMD